MIPKTFPGAFGAPLLMTLAMTVMTSVPASAQFFFDFKSYPASMCDVASPGSAADLRKDFAGRIMNTNPTQALSVICPFVRDHDDQNFVDGTVLLFDQHPVKGGSSDIHCTMALRDEHGNPLGLSSLSSESLATSTSILDAKPVTIKGPLSGQGRTFQTASMVCSIPPAFNDGSGIPKLSGLLMYSGREGANSLGQ